MAKQTKQEQTKITIEVLKQSLKSVYHIKEYQNLINILNNGGVLTPTQSKKFDYYSEQIDAVLNGKKDKYALEVNITQLARLFNVTPQAIDKWVKQVDFPYEAKKKHGIYDLYQVFNWYIQRNYGDNELSLRKSKANTEKEEAKARREQILTLIAEGKYKSVNTIVSALMLAFGVVNQALRDMPERLAPVIPDGAPALKSEAIRKEVVRILNTLHHDADKLIVNVLSGVKH